MMLHQSGSGGLSLSLINMMTWQACGLILLQLTVQAGRQTEEEVTGGNAEGNKLRKAIQKHIGERYAKKQVCSTITTTLDNRHLVCLCAQRARVCQNSSAAAALCFHLLAVVLTVSLLKTASHCADPQQCLYTHRLRIFTVWLHLLNCTALCYCHRYDTVLDIPLCSHASIVAVAQRRHLSTRGTTIC